MISSTFGAPLGGTTVGGHHGVESLALSLITPPNVGGGGGSCFPSIVVVALGEPGVPLICWAIAPGATVVARKTVNDRIASILIILLLRVRGSGERPPFVMNATSPRNPVAGARIVSLIKPN